jgi:hypothetical protein
MAGVRPHAFASCGGLVGYERAHLAVTNGARENSPRALAEPAPALKAPAAAPQRAAQGESVANQAGGFSTTNNQEPGVEEPDIVKTDGSTIFALEQGTLFALSTRPTLTLVGSLRLPGGAYGAQLLLRGSRLLVIAAGGPPVALRASVGRPLSQIAGASHTGSATPRTRPFVAPRAFLPNYAPSTTVTEVDAHNPAAMSVARMMTVEGSFVDARQNGATARLVISSAPRTIDFAAVRSRASAWLPTRRFRSFISGHHSSRPIAACSAVRYPAAFSGLGMLTILTIDLDRGLYATSSSALLADAQVVYGSQHSLYVATQRWINPLTPLANLPQAAETVIDKFDASSPGQTPLVSSGVVDGYLLNQFSLSEYQGYLRVASTSKPIWWWGSAPAKGESRVTVLADRGGALVGVGEVAGLGAGQELYSVRFIGDAGYVVTFRHVDPLYTIDLSSPSSPRIAGQLELEGYSAYLHPLGEGLLLGVGTEVSQEGRPTGSQLELFDVSNPSAPRLLAHTSLGIGSSSQVQFEHHAFLFWPPTSLAVLPVSIYTPIAPVQSSPPQATNGNAPTAPVRAEAGRWFDGAIAFRVSRSGIAELGRIAHDPMREYSPLIERSLVIGPQLFTISSEGVMASALSTLERQAFVTFPRQPQIAYPALPRG